MGDDLATQAQRLIATHCPQWAGSAIAPLQSGGTDNRLFRLGDDRVLRLPRSGRARESLSKECAWLPRLGPSLPLATPQPLYAAPPDTDGHPPWAVYHWLRGRDVWQADIEDPIRAANDLAQFVNALRRLPTRGAPKPGDHNCERGTALTKLDRGFRHAVAACGERIPAVPVIALWERALNAPAWQSDMWIHGDLQPGNLLVSDGRISAVIDFGLLGIGDPAVDLLPAWNLFDGEARRVYGEALHADEAAWQRAQGWGLYQAVMALPFYWDTNPTMVRLAHRTLNGIVREPV